ncbi:hypothetical protein SARC_13380 [Sphaeroforma arctica JP610]|uniref:Protein kinase domain-containing protein n=1 Tax=Sphaeroforma arctica JP610 TaxID=667725 RepID=A0A0L0FC88_9EUKA|nr:hypothetical protein SARC_13380 [Sphaeroforma arctica JP610]KNC74061.1 hypothetical protein SARC_13380 [Sphaeroforma arctica JP610]|eukprot:XP_014147963.1 hypothetical protein SARC_13380 [Sphaeroforma arctica JP610]
MSLILLLPPSLASQVGRLDINGVRQYTRQLTAGLAYLHQHHVVHGFVSPSSIFLTSDGHARIIQGEPLHRIHEFISTNDVTVESDDAHTPGTNTHANANNTHTPTHMGGAEGTTPRR